MNRTHPRTDTLAAHPLPKPSPHSPDAEALGVACEKHNGQLIHVVGNNVCACGSGCIYSYPKLELLMEV